MRPLALFLAAILAACLAAPPAGAGAWPRKQGSGFGSIAVRLGWPQDMSTWTSMDPTQDYSTLFFEYGLTDRLTLGFDIGHSVGGSGKSVLFLQWPLRQAETGAQMTAQFGLGTIAGEQVLRPGLSVGWGLQNGWLSIDSVAEAYVDSGRTDLKMDVTWGRNLPRDRKLILQLQTGQPDGYAPFVRVAPSLVVPLRGPLKLESGVTWGLTGDTSMGLKMGLWTEF
ncbi:hypothetical protein [Mameliella alba]|uniref:hypothetical protein n=1 Tax=Mameliella alba TaxID=561184 RepID=UPI000B53349C|nr:hypothetical protein [Mameliella alba]MBY6118774.1 hypothetical protein [Mameliella alba]OWV43711.1 hypothetical protein CDZ95_08550 [Mameliella alba]OWV67381.1 hypothetical protein CDZ97_02780 [Mameliella alba]